MGAVAVRDPEGHEWRVRRRWVPHTVRWRGPTDVDAFDPAGIDLVPFADDLGCLPAIGIVVTSVVLVALAVFVVVPALLFAVELLVALAVVALGAAGRVVLRRPWTVEARRLDTRNEGREWRVVGWRASGDRIRTVAERLRATGGVGEVTWSDDGG